MQHLVLLYSIEDASRVKDLENALKVLVNRKDISVWSRAKMPPGAVVRDVVEKKFAEADVFVVLLSADFLALEEEDFERVRQAERAAAVFVLLRPCGWQHTWLSGGQEDDSKLVPRRKGKAVPVTSFSDPADAWQEVLTEIASVVRRRAAGSP